MISIVPTVFIIITTILLAFHNIFTEKKLVDVERFIGHVGRVKRRRIEEVEVDEANAAGDRWVRIDERLFQDCSGVRVI